MKIYKTKGEVKIPKNMMYAVVTERGKVKSYTLHKSSKRSYKRVCSIKGPCELYCYNGWVSVYEKGKNIVYAVVTERGKVKSYILHKSSTRSYKRDIISHAGDCRTINCISHSSLNSGTMSNPYEQIPAPGLLRRVINLVKDILPW